MSDYVELQVTSNFSFLRGGSHPDELMKQAHAFGYKTIAMTDRNSLAGVVRGHCVARDNKMRLIVGCRLDLQDGLSLLAYPTDRAAYARLSTLLTVGKLRAPKGECHLRRADVYEHSKGLKFIAIIPPDSQKYDDRTEQNLREYRQAFGRDLYLAATHYYIGDDARR
ncbi:MAG TPA: PHP domain-containing protein, partial [Patescibacteria group bacterium]|nr:PHP domain-containing protein [Patescibacteria group bacterium]